MHRIVNIPLSNTYGNVTAIRDSDKFFLLLDDYSSTDRVEISAELFWMIESEFN